MRQFALPELLVLRFELHVDRTIITRNFEENFIVIGIVIFPPFEGATGIVISTNDS